MASSASRDFLLERRTFHKTLGLGLAAGIAGGLGLSPLIEEKNLSAQEKAGDNAAAPVYPDKTKLLVYLDEKGQEKPITRPQEWRIRRRHILANMQKVMGNLPADDKKVPSDMKILETKELERCVRQKITFAVEQVGEQTDRLPGYLFIPKGIKGRVPAALCLHQTIQVGKDEPAGLGGSRTRHYALQLAERGFVTLAVDYPNFGEYKFNPYENGYASATMKGIWNHMRSVDLLQSLPEVDPEKIGVIGHSLGGHNSIFVAAFDTRIRCTVSSCGFNAFTHYEKGDIAGWSHNGYMPRIKERHQARAEKMPFDFPEIIGLLAPRAFFTNSPLHDDNFAVEGVKICIAAATPVYKLLGAEGNVAARYPDSQHDFPDAVREESYQWMREKLNQ